MTNLKNCLASPNFFNPEMTMSSGVKRLKKGGFRNLDTVSPQYFLIRISFPRAKFRKFVFSTHKFSSSFGTSVMAWSRAVMSPARPENPDTSRCPVFHLPGALGGRSWEKPRSCGSPGADGAAHKNEPCARRCIWPIYPLMI